jgi:SRSO17 transposase
MDKVGVPQENRTYKSKIEIALDLVVDIRKRLKIHFQWVVFDAFYGRDLGLLRKINLMDITFMAQIPESHQVFTKDFEVKIPKRKSKRGRKFTKPRPTRTSISVKAYAKKLRTTDWSKLTVRKTSTGSLKAYYHRVPVWLFNEKDLKKVRFTLLIRKDLNGDISYHLTNSRAHIQRLAYMQGQRYFVEQEFREAMQELGMDQYQVRGYKAWHKHMALVMMAQLYVQKIKVCINSAEVEVTTQDVVTVIKFLLLPTKKLEQVIHQIQTKNKTVLAKIRYLTK